MKVLLISETEKKDRIIVKNGNNEVFCTYVEFKCASEIFNVVSNLIQTLEQEGLL